MIDNYELQLKTINMDQPISIKNFFIRFPFAGAMIAQLTGLFFIKILIESTHWQASSLSLLLLQIIFATLISQFVFKLPKWFFAISILFPIFIYISFHYFSLSQSFYGILFFFFALTFSHTLKERVPLYLTNNQTHLALKAILENEKAKTFLDLGSGLGGVVRAMSSDQIKSEGVESAPLLWIVSSLLSVITFKGKIWRKNIWKTNLSQFDVVYAFLSPAIMTKLYQKVKGEMPKGSLFITNSFVVEDFKPSKIIELNDERKTKLYLYFL